MVLAVGAHRLGARDWLDVREVDCSGGTISFGGVWLAYVVGSHNGAPPLRELFRTPPSPPWRLSYYGIMALALAWHALGFGMR